ncbi:MAG TPA: secretin N-terminal domain-containing protein, partial [Candidatus Sumerlaeota bacterium]|nr:secretin N-terminal domain-containing protein [Candidatus Sumerlaeota bacterium]
MDSRNSIGNRKVRGWTLGLLLGAGALFQVTSGSQAAESATPPGGGGKPVAGAVVDQSSTATLNRQTPPAQPAAPQAAPVQPEKAAVPTPQPGNATPPVQLAPPQAAPVQPEKAAAPTPTPALAQPEKAASPTPLPEKTFPERVDDGGAGRAGGRGENNRNNDNAKPASNKKENAKENGEKAAAGKDEDVKIRLNFRGADLDTVLNYLSEAAGFIISREVDVKGKIDVWSEQPISRDEALELLNTVLNVKGYATSRNGRILRIVKRDEAKFENLPVHIGSDPEQIPESEEIVTQIIPIRSTDATKLTQTLQPLLPDYSIMTPNAGSNTIVLTDTQINIRRMCKIIKGLDSTVSNILDVKVYQLKNADATAVASMIEKVLQPPTSSGSGSSGDRRGGGGPGEFFMRMRGGFGGGGDQQGGDNASSEARSAASKIVALPDTRTNSVVVNAPAETHAAIQALVNQIDTMAQDVTNLRVFPLQYADSETLAKTLTSLFTANSTSSNQNQQGMGGGRMPPWMRQPETQSDSSKSDRAVLEAKVTIVAEVQTNSLIVSASESSMSAVETLIKKFDTPPNGVTDVRIYKLQYADSEELASTLSSLFQARSTGSTSSRNTSAGFGGGRFGGGMFGGMGGMQGRNNQSSSTSKSDRQKQTEQIN